MSTIDEEIRAKTQAFATELAVLVRRAALEAVATTLGSSAAPIHGGHGGYGGSSSGGAPKAARAPVAVTGGTAAKRGRGRPRKAAPVAPAKAPVAPVKSAAKTGPAPAAKPTTSKKAPKRVPGAKRPPAELAKLVDRLGEYIKANPGRRMEVIAKALGEPTKDLNLPVKKLLTAKKIRSEGHKRATEYFPA